MSCERFDDRLVELACGELAPDEAREVEAHAAGCPACAGALASMCATRRTMAALVPEPAPEAGEKLLLAAGRAQARRNAARRRRWIGMWIAPVAVAAGLALTVSWPLLSNPPRSLGRADPEALAAKSGAPYAAAPAEQRAVEDADRYAQAEPAAPTSGAEPPAPPPGRYAVPPPVRERASRSAEPVRTPLASAPARKAARPAAEAGASGAMASAERDAEPAARNEPAAREGDLRAAVREERAAAEAEEAPAFAQAPPPAPAAPAPSAEPGPTRSRAERRAPGAAAPSAMAAPSAAPAAPSASDERADAPSGSAQARARYEALRAAGKLRGELRTFPGCEGEAWRKVELDPQGRVVRYVREGVFEGRRLRVEQLYDASGALAEAEAIDLDAGGGQRTPARALGLDVPLRADLANADVPPRCGR